MSTYSSESEEENSRVDLDTLSVHSSYDEENDEGMKLCELISKI
jgi:hypothetical protein